VSAASAVLTLALIRLLRLRHWNQPDRVRSRPPGLQSCTRWFHSCHRRSL